MHAGVGGQLLTCSQSQKQIDCIVSLGYEIRDVPSLQLRAVSLYFPKATRHSQIAPAEYQGFKCANLW